MLALAQPFAHGAWVQWEGLNVNAGGKLSNEAQSAIHEGEHLPDYISPVTAKNADGSHVGAYHDSFPAHYINRMRLGADTQGTVLADFFNSMLHPRGGGAMHMNPDARLEFLEYPPKPDFRAAMTPQVAVSIGKALQKMGEDLLAKFAEEIERDRAEAVAEALDEIVAIERARWEDHHTEMANDE